MFRRFRLRKRLELRCSSCEIAAWSIVQFQVCQVQRCVAWAGGKRLGRVAQNPLEVGARTDWWASMTIEINCMRLFFYMASCYMFMFMCCMFMYWVC